MNSHNCLEIGYGEHFITKETVIQIKNHEIFTVKKLIKLYNNSNSIQHEHIRNILHWPV